MKLQERDRRALAGLGVAAILSLIIFLWPTGSPAGKTPMIVNSIPMAEVRINKLREIIATLPGKQKVLDGVGAQLKDREKGMLVAETAAQAQAQLVQTVRKLGRNQSPPLDIGQYEMGPIQNLGKDYGEALVNVNFNCRIEQLVNLLADITAHPELVATYSMDVRSGDPKQKTIGVRLTVAGIIPKKLVPERKGVTIF